MRKLTLGIACICAIAVVAGPTAGAVAQQSGESPYGPDPQEAQQLKKVKRIFLRAISRSLLKQGFSKKGARCVVNNFGSRLSDADVRKIAKGQSPKGLTKRLKSSVRICARRMGQAIVA